MSKHGNSSAGDWDRAREVFGEALDLPPEARSAFLRGVVGSSPELERELSSLLEAHAAAGEFLQDQPTVLASFAAADLAASEAALPERIGRYTILRVLGSGGMGKVFLAERADASYLGPVAIKVAAAGFDSSELQSRLERERNVLGRLDHPSIARLLDGGYTQEGRPFFVIEYVQGESLDVFVRKTRPNLRGVLELFLEICDAVDYAHRRLVVHRDLKPSNILVVVDAQGRPRPKLLDFGIAKLLEPSQGPDRLTLPGKRWMTVAYASPELVRGESITTASDVYSLGVLLFELVTGRLPYTPGLNDFDLQRAICEDDPPRASAVAEARPHENPARLRSQLRGDLDGILAAALRKEAERRYGSPAALAADIRCFLEGRPLSIRPDSFWYVATRFARRNRALTATAVLLILSWSIGSLAALWQAGRIQREAQLVQRINTYLEGILSWPEPELRGRELTLLEAIDRMAGSIDEAFSDSPDVAASLHARLGKTYQRLGRSLAGRAHLERSLSIRRERGDPDAVAESLHDLAELEFDAWNVEQAEALAREALALRAGRSTTEPGALADTQDLLGLALSALSRAEEGEGWIRSALELRSTMGSSAEEDLCLSWNNLGHVQTILGHFDEAAESLLRGLDLARRILPADHPHTALLLANLAEARLALGEREEAAVLLDESVQIRIGRFGEQHIETCRALNRLGETLTSLNRLDEAGEHLERSLRVLEAMRASGHPDPEVSRLRLDALRGLATLRRSSGDARGAETLYRSILKDGTAAEGDHRSQDTARLLATTLYDQGRLPEALQVIEQHFLAKVDPSQREEPLQAPVAQLLAEIHLGLGDLELAREVAQSACSIFSTDGSGWMLGGALSVLAEIELADSRLEQAREAGVSAHEMLADAFGSSPNTLLARARSLMAELEIADGRPAEAVRLLAEVLPILVERRGREHPWTQQALERARRALDLSPSVEAADSLRP